MRLGEARLAHLVLGLVVVGLALAPAGQALVLAGFENPLTGHWEGHGVAREGTQDRWAARGFCAQAFTTFEFTLSIDERVPPTSFTALKISATHVTTDLEETTVSATATPGSPGTIEFQRPTSCWELNVTALEETSPTSYTLTCNRSC